MIGLDLNRRLLSSGLAYPIFPGPERSYFVDKASVNQILATVLRERQDGIADAFRDKSLDGWRG